MDFNILILGDSVPWGQGLMDEQKYHMLLKDRIRSRHPDWKVLSQLLAHSGAVIRSASPEPPAVDAEVPVSYPSILTQASSAAASNPNIDVVILNGGINDIDIRFILNPFTSEFDLTDMVRVHCLRSMQKLLFFIARAFSKAIIILTGYYPILSPRSFTQPLPSFLDCIGVPMPQFATEDLVFSRVIGHAMQFWLQSEQRFQQAVDQANARLGNSGSVRLFYASNAFDETHSVYADDPWLFGLDPALNPVDPIAQPRHQSCDLFIPPENFFGREQCYRASAGHPNPTGARMYAEAIDSVLKTQGI